MSSYNLINPFSGDTDGIIVNVYANRLELEEPKWGSTMIPMKNIVSISSRIVNKSSRVIKECYCITVTLIDGNRNDFYFFNKSDWQKLKQEIEDLILD